MALLTRGSLDACGLSAEGGGPYDHPENERADEGQNFDSLLDSNEQNWESKMGRLLPPGWAHCRNMGTHVNGIVPIKVPPPRRCPPPMLYHMWYSLAVQQDWPSSTCTRPRTPDSIGDARYTGTAYTR